MTDHCIRRRYFWLLIAIAAFLIITCVHLGQLAIGQGGEKRASVSANNLKCGDDISLFPLNQLPGTRDSENYYIGNPHTKVFHRPSCHYLPAPDKRMYFESRAQAVDAGYRPCQRCNP